MIRTLKWLFKKPWGIVHFIIQPRRAIAHTKAFVASNWYLDIKESTTLSNADKDHLLWFMDSRIQKKYGHEHKKGWF